MYRLTPRDEGGANRYIVALHRLTLRGYLLIDCAD